MNYRFLLFLALIILQVELCTSQNRYCPEAVASVKVVDSCPTSKTEWDVAARKKDCGRMASKQTCTTVEKFQYHCVVNGLRSKLLEVCAPTRIIFGHCVEFNVRGGVIQDQLSTPCNATFPKCTYFYLSSDVYKYSDCYKLVLKKDESSLEQTTTTTTSKDTLLTTNESSHMKPIYIISIIVSIAIPPVAVVLAFIYKRIREQQFNGEQHNKNDMEMFFHSNDNYEGCANNDDTGEKPSIKINDEENTCPIINKIDGEKEAVKIECIRKEPPIKSEDNENTCLIPKTVDGEKGTVKKQYRRKVPSIDSKDEEKTLLIPKTVDNEKASTSTPTHTAQCIRPIFASAYLYK